MDYLLGFIFLFSNKKALSIKKACLHTYLRLGAIEDQLITDMPLSQYTRLLNELSISAKRLFEVKEKKSGRAEAARL
jgi:hypothetical protein